MFFPASKKQIVCFIKKSLRHLVGSVGGLDSCSQSHEFKAPMYSVEITKKTTENPNKGYLT